MSETILSVFSYLKKELMGYYEEQEAVHLARMVLEYLYEERWQALWQQNNRLLREENWIKVKVFLKKLLEHEPIQYVLQEAYFYDRKFYVDNNVLIPRGETEELMLWVVEEAQKRNAPCQILDIGTGSGCIPISVELALKEKGIQAHISGLDISEKALAVAQKNAIDLGAEVAFFQANVLDFNTLPTQKWDIIVSNPPYVPIQDLAEMSPHVKDFEPHLALFVSNEDPLIFYRKIAEWGKTSLTEKGILLFEIYTAYAQAVCEMLAAMGYRQLVCKQDIHGKARMVGCQKS